MKNYQINIKNDKDLETRISKFKNPVKISRHFRISTDRIGHLKKAICFLIFPLLLIIMFLLSCSDHKLENPFDAENTLPAPTNLLITQTSFTSCILNWQDNSEGEQGFKIDRKKDSEEWIIAYQTVNENVETLSETNLNATSTYQYRVYGFADENTSAPITGVINMTFPAPTNLSITATSITSCILNWQDNSEGEQGFKIDRKKDSDEWIIAYQTVGENVETLTETNLNATSTYQYRVYGFADENTTTIIEGIINMSFPAPTNLQITQTTITSCHLTWEDNSLGEDGFRIDRKKDNEDWQLGYAEVGANVTEFDETGLNINSNYSYRVYGYCGSNSTVYIESSIAVVIPAPTNLNYTFENQSGTTADIHLDWDYTASGIDGFKVKKNGTLLPDIIPAGTTEWIDYGVAIGYNFTYQVLAFYQSYNSALSNEIVIEVINCIDFDGNVYDIVQIGDQIWMAENLKVTHYRNGDPIPNVTSNSTWAGLSTGAYCFYNNTPANADTYGNLYNWYAVDDSRGLAPDGWHVPTDTEIMELEMYLGMSQSQANSTGLRGTNEGSKLAGNAALWAIGALENDPEFGSSGFDFLPGGYRYNYNGSFSSLGYYGHFWLATENNTYNAWHRELYYNDSQVARNGANKQDGFSVRCIRD